MSIMLRLRNTTLTFPSLQNRRLNLFGYFCLICLFLMYWWPQGVISSLLIWLCARFRIIQQRLHFQLYLIWSYAPFCHLRNRIKSNLCLLGELNWLYCIDFLPLCLIQCLINIIIPVDWFPLQVWSLKAMVIFNVYYRVVFLISSICKSR